jgi:GNAT superfamily N-acetyltransferase
MSTRVRLATTDEIPALRELIERSFRTLAAAHYPPAVIEVACGSIIRIDPELVSAGTYFVVERDGVRAACGGWSDRVPTVRDLPMPIPRAEVRATFVLPEHAGHGLGKLLLEAAEHAIAAAGFATAHLVATRSGREFFRRAGYQPLAEHTVMLAGDQPFPLTCMSRPLAA